MCVLRVTFRGWGVGGWGSKLFDGGDRVLELSRWVLETGE